MKVLAPPLALNRTALEISIQEYTGCSESTAKRRVNEMVDFDFIKKHDDGYYRSIL